MHDDTNDAERMARILKENAEAVDRMAADRDKRRADLEQSGELAEFTGIEFFTPGSGSPATDDVDAGEPLAVIRTLAELVAKAQALLAEHGDLPLEISASIHLFDVTACKDARVIYEPYRDGGGNCLIQITL